MNIGVSVHISAPAHVIWVLEMHSLSAKLVNVLARPIFGRTLARQMAGLKRVAESRAAKV
jgi:hypothetical protein